MLECERCRELALRELARRDPAVDLAPERLAKVLPYRQQSEPAAASLARTEVSRTETEALEAPASSPQAERAESPGPSETPGSPSFEARLRRSLAKARDEMEDGAGLLRELQAHDLEAWPRLFEERPCFLSAALVGELIDLSWEVSYQDPLRAVEIARKALTLLDVISPERYAGRFLLDLRLRAWTRVGAGYRFAGQLAASERAFRRAEALAEDCPDPQEVAAYYQLCGSLRKDQRRFHEALEMYQESYRLSAEIGDRDRTTRVLICIGAVHMEKGEPENALPPLLDALASMDGATEDRVSLFGRTNLAGCFIELGDFVAAREMFESCRAEYEATPDSHVQLRVQWLEGRIEAGLGDIARAEQLLSAARNGYLERGLHYDAALVSLHLAALYARNGQVASVRSLAEEMAVEFLAQDIPAEAMAALAFFRQAVEQECATEQLVGGVARFLQRAQNDPSLKFCGA